MIINNFNHFITNKYFYILIILNIFSHFIPIERISISPDDFAYFLREFHGLDNFYLAPDRPIRYMWADFQNYIIGTNHHIALIFLLLSNFLIILSVYNLINLFNFGKLNSFFICVIYSLVLSKIEIFHSSTFIHINIVSSLYIYSLYFFIKSLNKENYFFLTLSIIFYSVSILWYEVGFFLPLVYLFYFCYENNSLNYKKIIIFISPFFIIAILYLLNRYFGYLIYKIEINHGHQIGTTFNTFKYGINDIFNLFLGKSFFRILIYGFYNFVFINFKYLILIIFFDIIFIFFIYKLSSNNSLKFVLSKKNLYFLLILFIILLIPNLINGSIGGRNIIISSIPFSIFIFYVLINLGSVKKFMFILFLSIGLVASQGNTLTQVISLRIQNEIYKNLLINKDDIIKNEILIIDKKSFATNINFSLTSYDYNVLDTYFGAQCLEDWGLASIVNNILIDHKDKLKLYIAYDSPIKDKNNNLNFTIAEYSGYRKIIKKNISIPNNNIMIVDFDDVYDLGFIQGLNKN